MIQPNYQQLASTCKCIYSEAVAAQFGSTELARIELN